MYDPYMTHMTYMTYMTHTHVWPMHKPYTNVWPTWPMYGLCMTHTCHVDPYGPSMTHVWPWPIYDQQWDIHGSFGSCAGQPWVSSIHWSYGSGIGQPWSCGLCMGYMGQPLVMYGSYISHTWVIWVIMGQICHVYWLCMGHVSVMWFACGSYGSCMGEPWVTWVIYG